MPLVQISRRLCARVSRLRFDSPVAHVYNPLAYARRPHELYLERYGAGPKQVLLLGMNPGPFGMAQTGVPFGDVESVRSWLGIEAEVKRPRGEHEKRPVSGFACNRREISGSRLWGLARDRWGAPQRFFERFFVVNYCPLAFLEQGGKNRTPDRLPGAERDALYAPCDEALRAIVEQLAPRLVVGIGGFAEKRALHALGALDVRIGSVLHPSPASPAANRGWADQAVAQLRALGIDVPGD